MVAIGQKLAGLSLAVTVAYAQTPTGIWPPAQAPIAASYDDTQVFAGMHLPRPVTAIQPAIYGMPPLPDTYMILMLDMSVSAKRYFHPSEFRSLIRGSGTGRTTCLHWWQPNATLPSTTDPSAFTFHGGDDDGSSSDSGGESSARAAAWAPYLPPAPPRGDGPHTYVVWLFRQRPTYEGPVGAAIDAWSHGVTTQEGLMARLNFSIEAVVSQVGMPVAATYFRVENEANNHAVGQAVYLNDVDRTRAIGKARREYHGAELIERRR